MVHPDRKSPTTVPDAVGCAHTSSRQPCGPDSGRKRGLFGSPSGKARLGRNLHKPLARSVTCAPAERSRTQRRLKVPVSQTQPLPIRVKAARSNLSQTLLHSSMAWNQRWDPEERYPQAGTHFQNLAKARLTQRAEVVRGGSSWTFVPKVDVGVALSEGAATKPKGSVVPKVDVRVAAY